MRTLEELREYFAGDTFAAALGIQIDSVDPNTAVCSVALRADHLNALGFAQGGLVYSLADFAFAVAANTARASTVTLQCAINYLRPSKAARLVATATPRSLGRTVCVYEVLITDDTGAEVALVSATGFTRTQGEGEEKQAIIG